MKLAWCPCCGTFQCFDGDVPIEHDGCTGDERGFLGFWRWLIEEMSTARGRKQMWAIAGRTPDPNRARGVIFDWVKAGHPTWLPAVQACYARGRDPFDSITDIEMAGR